MPATATTKGRSDPEVEQSLAWHQYRFECRKARRQGRYDEVEPWAGPGCRHD